MLSMAGRKNKRMIPCWAEWTTCLVGYYILFCEVFEHTVQGLTTLCVKIPQLTFYLRAGWKYRECFL